MKFFSLVCTNCPEPTKKIVGFADGFNEITGKETHHPLFECNSEECPLSLLHKEEFKEREKQIAEAKYLNSKNGISAKDLRQARCQAGLIIGDVCAKFNIFSSQYSKYENELIPIPPEMYKEFMNYFKECEKK